MRTNVIATLLVVLALFTGACAGRQVRTRTVPAPVAVAEAPQPVLTVTDPVAVPPSIEADTAVPADPAPAAKVVPAEPETTLQVTDDGPTVPTIDEDAARAAEARKELTATLDRYAVLIAEMEAEEKAARKELLALRKQRARARAATAALAEPEIVIEDEAPVAGFLDGALAASPNFVPPEGGIPNDPAAAGPARDQAPPASADEIVGIAGAKSLNVHDAGSMTPTERLFAAYMVGMALAAVIGFFGGILLSRRRPTWPHPDEDAVPLAGLPAVKASSDETNKLLPGTMLVTELVSGKSVRNFEASAPVRPSIDAPNDPALQGQAPANDLPSIIVDDQKDVGENLDGCWFFQPPAEVAALATSQPSALPRLAEGSGPLLAAVPTYVDPLGEKTDKVAPLAPPTDFDEAPLGVVYDSTHPTSSA